MSNEPKQTRRAHPHKNLTHKHSPHATKSSVKSPGGKFLLRDSFSLCRIILDTTLNQCWFNVGPTRVDQHKINIGSMSHCFGVFLLRPPL